MWGGYGDDTYIINSNTFYVYDIGGNDKAIVNIDFVKIPSSIENIVYATGVRALPYWISALLYDDAARYSSLLGSEKVFYFGFPKPYKTISGKKILHGHHLVIIRKLRSERFLST